MREVVYADFYYVYGTCFFAFDAAGCFSASRNPNKSFKQTMNAHIEKADTTPEGRQMKCGHKWAQSVNEFVKNTGGSTASSSSSSIISGKLDTSTHAKCIILVKCYVHVYSSLDGIILFSVCENCGFVIKQGLATEAV